MFAEIALRSLIRSTGRGGAGPPVGRGDVRRRYPTRRDERAPLVDGRVEAPLAAEDVVAAPRRNAVDVAPPEERAGDLRPPRVVIGVYADEPGPVPVVHVERRILADRKHEDHRRRRDLDAAAEQKPVAVERGRVQDDENNGSEVKFGFSFTFFIFLEGLAEIKSPHAIGAMVSP